METSTSNSLKKTPLHTIHTTLNAKMMGFAGYDMPIQYTGINEEHSTVREKVGMFDVSHMGEFIVKGENALAFLQYVTTNDVSSLSIGKAQYSCLPNGKGGIVDDLLVYKLAENTYMLVVNASNIEKDWNWLQSNNTFGVDMEDISSKTALLAVQGPLAIQTLQKLTSTNLTDIPYYHFSRGTLAGISNVLLSATGYTGAGGMELYVENQHAETIWKAIMEAGEEFGIQAIGLGARDTLRLEMGYCLYGNDIDDTTNPIESGLGWITKFSKDFIDKEYLLEQKTNGTAKKLVAFQALDRNIPRHGYALLNEAKQKIGEVTSGTISPSLKYGIGVGYVTSTEATLGNTIYVQIRDKQCAVKIVKLPFWKV